METNKLTITSIYEKNKVLMKPKVNPNQELDVQYMKDRLNARDGFLVGIDSVPKRLRKHVPDFFVDKSADLKNSKKTFIG